MCMLLCFDLLHVHVCVVLLFSSRLDELRIFMETEAWELCPVRSTFTIHQLRVCDNILTKLYFYC